MVQVLIGFRQRKRDMSKINAGLYSSEDHTWMTPPELVNAVLAFEGRSEFDLDPCCSIPNIPAAWRYIYPEWDGLVLPWNGLAWCNPPYGNLLAKFMEKMAREARRGARVWAIVPARTETKYQHEHGLTAAGFSVFMKKRICFVKHGQTAADPKANAPFPTMLLYYGDDWAEKAVRWERNPAWPGSLMIPATGLRAHRLLTAQLDLFAEATA